MEDEIVFEPTITEESEFKETYGDWGLLPVPPPLESKPVVPGKPKVVGAHRFPSARVTRKSNSYYDVYALPEITQDGLDAYVNTLNSDQIKYFTTGLPPSTVSKSADSALILCRCNGCGNTAAIEETLTIGNSSTNKCCKDCYNRKRAIDCISCNLLMWRNGAFAIEEGYKCSICFEKENRYCGACGGIFPIDTPFHDNNTCVPCYRRRQLGNSFCDNNTVPFELSTEQFGVIKAEQLIKVEFEQSTITEQDRGSIIQNLVNLIGNNLDTPVILSDVDGSRLHNGIEWVDKTERGRLNKRIEEWLRIHKNYKLDKSEKDKLGNLITKVVKPINNPIVFFTRNLNQGKNYFMNNNSCWWSNQYASRCVMKQYGGFGVMIKNNNEITGRAWGLFLDEKGRWTTNYKERILIFNAYGYDINFFASILNNITGLAAQPCLAAGEYLYINRVNGYLLQKQFNSMLPKVMLKCEKHCTC